MKFAFCLFKYFPYGGLQRDFLRIARECLKRGHEIDVYTMQWEGKEEPGLSVYLIPATGWQNHRRNRSFIEKAKARLFGKHYDLVVGFNKMPYLDVYYAADVCYQARIRQQRGLLHHLTPRYRQLMADEKAVFGTESKTQVLLISPLQQVEYQQYYGTLSKRFHLLPPGIAHDRVAPTNAEDIRQAIRESYHISPEQFLLLMVGSGFKTKGVDRALYAVAALPDNLRSRCRLLVIGQDNPQALLKLSRKLHIKRQVQFLGGRDDVPHFLLAADLLLHPAYHENTGTVLLEALVSGLPVLTTAVCGYAHYVQEAKAGVVLPVPFVQAQFTITLRNILLSEKRLSWRENALAFAKTADIYSMPERAVDVIERLSSIW